LPTTAIETTKPNTNINAPVFRPYKKYFPMAKQPSTNLTLLKLIHVRKNRRGAFIVNTIHASILFAKRATSSFLLSIITNYPYILVQQTNSQLLAHLMKTTTFGCN